MTSNQWGAYLCLWICLLISQTVLAQVEVLNSNPPSVKWYRMGSPRFDVLFDQGMEKEAQRVLNTLEYLYNPVSQSLGVKPRKISVLLQNHNVVPNGFVTQTPRRSEFNLFPSQDQHFTGLLDWVDLLAVHEYRHVVQFDKSLTKFNKFIFYLFGYQGASAMAHVAMPEWYWEGDAVITETVFTNSGRGRNPAFGMLYRTNLQERGPFGYPKQFLRSFKHLVPDHYVTGYYMTSFLRKKYGSDIISKSVEETWAWPFIPFRFSNRIKKYTGHSLVGNYHLMSKELDSLWARQKEQNQLTHCELISQKKNKTYTDYDFPNLTSDGKIVALKSGIGDIQTFVCWEKSGEEKKIFSPGILTSSNIPSVAGQLIAWNEMEYDPRWPSRNWSVIKIYNILSGKIKKISGKTRYLSTGLSPDGKKLVTIHAGNDLRYQLLIIDSETGDQLVALPNPENYYFFQPRWTPDGNGIVSVRMLKGIKDIWLYHMDSGREFIYKGFGEENIGNPYLYGKYVLYNSPYSGIDNIYAFDIEENQVYQVTSRPYGAFNAIVSPDGERIIFHDYSKDGMNVVQMPFHPSTWRKMEEVVIVREEYFKPIEKEEPTIDLKKIKNEFDFQSLPVNKFKEVFNPYSWGPYITSTNLDFFIGLSMQDILSTSRVNAGYELNANELTGRWVGNISYQALYPVMNLEAYSGFREIKESFRQTDSSGVVSDTSVLINWRENGIKAGIALPFTFTRSRYLEYLELSFNAGYNRISGYDFPIRYLDQQGDGDLLANNYRLIYYHLLKRSKRDIYSRFGQIFISQLEHTPFGGDYNGRMFSAETRLYFPGIVRHHSMNFRLGYLNQDLNVKKGSYRFSTILFYPRGYGYVPYEDLWVGSMNYSLPLVYPDLAIGSLVYIQRVTTNLFYDQGNGLRNGESSLFNSVGFEMNFDFNLMRFLTPFNMGFRFYYRLEDGGYNFQFLIGEFGF